MYCLMCQRSLKESCSAKLMRACKINCQNYLHALEKAIVHSTVEVHALDLEEYTGQRRICMCYVQELFKCLWHNESWVNNCQVRDVWFFKGCFSVHEKLFNK